MEINNSNAVFIYRCSYAECLYLKDSNFVFLHSKLLLSKLLVQDLGNSDFTYKYIADGRLKKIEDN